MSSISRRRNGLMALSVIGGSCLGCGLQPLDLKTGRLLLLLPTNYRGSGLVLRRDLAVQARLGEGPLTTRLSRSRRVLRTADVGQQERFALPRLSGRCRSS